MSSSQNTPPEINQHDLPSSLPPLSSDSIPSVAPKKDWHHGDRVPCRWKGGCDREAKKGDRHYLCPIHKSLRSHQAKQLPSSSSPSLSLPSTPLDIPLTRHDQRMAMIILRHLYDFDYHIIAYLLNCDYRRVQHWIEKYENEVTIDDNPRSGRPRSTTVEEDECIAALLNMMMKINQKNKKRVRIRRC